MGDAQHFVDRGDAEVGLQPAGGPQRYEPVRFAQRADLAERPAGNDALARVIVHLQELVDTGAPAVARLRTRLTTRSAAEARRRALGNIGPGEILGGRLVG